MEVQTPRSNAPGFWIGAAGAALLVGGLAALHPAADGPNWPLIGLAFFPCSIATAELRSGYAWKNLSPGNRGAARFTHPGRYWLSVGWHGAMAIAIVALGFFRR